MKDLFIIPECYIDTNLVETLIITDGCNHQKGCNTVVKTMQQKFANAFSVGIIGELCERVFRDSAYSFITA